MYLLNAFTTNAAYLSRLHALLVGVDVVIVLLPALIGPVIANNLTLLLNLQCKYRYIVVHNTNNTGLYIEIDIQTDIQTCMRTYLLRLLGLNAFHTGRGTVLPVQYYESINVPKA
jgi:hypothetical protein